MSKLETILKRKCISCNCRLPDSELMLCSTCKEQARVAAKLLWRYDLRRSLTGAQVTVERYLGHRPTSRVKTSAGWDSRI